MFKILGLNCLTSAYVMSVQFLDGVKFGDAQMTAGGLLTAAMFLSLSRACPEERLASAPRARVRVRAGGDVFLAAQFAAHLAFLLAAVEVARRTAGDANSAPEYVSRPNASARVHPLDAPFAPSPINTVSFLVNVLTQTATAAVNYAGAPHSAPLARNAPLLYSVLAAYVALAALLAEVWLRAQRGDRARATSDGSARVRRGAAAADLGACWAADRDSPPRSSETKRRGEDAGGDAVERKKQTVLSLLSRR